MTFFSSVVVPTYVDYTISNIGGEATGNLAINVTGLELISSDAQTSLAFGESVTITVLAEPTGSFKRISIFLTISSKYERCKWTN